MQYYPRNLVYAEVCFTLAVVSFCGYVLSEYEGLMVAAVLFVIAGVGFVLSSVNGEVWDDGFMGRRL